MVILVVIMPVFMVLQFQEDTSGDLLNEGSLKSHSPIVIDGDNDFTSENGVVRGKGTEVDPYIIENLSISVVNVGIKIINTNLHFKIVNCKITGRWSNNVENGTILDHGIWIGSPNGSVISCRLSNNFIGLYGTGTDLEVLDNRFDHCSSSIVMEGKKASVTDNILTNYLNFGMHFSNSEALLVQNNILKYQLDKDIVANGMSLSNCSGFSICNNICTGTVTGIDISNSSKNKIFSNFIRNNDTKGDNGMILVNSNDNILKNNSFMECGFIMRGDSIDSYISNDIDSSNSIGDLPIIFIKNSSNTRVNDDRMGTLIISNCSNVEVLDLEIKDRFMSLTVTFSSHVKVHNILFRSTRKGLVFHDVDDLTIVNSSLDIRGPEPIGVYLEKCVDIKISNNYIYGADLGVYGKSINHSTIQLNDFAFNKKNILIESDGKNKSNNNWILKNNIQHGLYGVMVIGDDNIIEGNRIRSVSESGIEIDQKNNSMKNNEVSGSIYGIRTNSGTVNANIVNNTLFFNGIGILIDTCADGRSIVRNNRMTLNEGYGIKIAEWGVINDRKPEFIIYNNTFKSNNKGLFDVPQAYDPLNISKWDDSNGRGNYWGDYEDKYVPPAIGNGIYWNISYSIDGGAGSRDNFPLINDPNGRTNLLMLSGKEEETAFVGIDYLVEYDVVYLSDGEVLWSFRSNASWLNFSEDHVLQGRPDLNDMGDYWVNISVSDGKLQDWANFTLSVIYKNFHPKITTEDLVSIDQWRTYYIDYDALDQQMNLVWELSTEATFLKIDPITGALSGVPGLNDVGTFHLNVSVNDGELYDSQHFDLTVNDVNDPPMMNRFFENLFMDEDQILVLIITEVFFNYDNDRLVVKEVNTSSNINKSIDEGRITLSPIKDYYGNDIIEFTVEDGHYSKSFVSNLVVRPQNDAPRDLMISLTMGRFIQGDFLMFKAKFSDPESDDLNVTWYIDGSIVGYGQFLNITLLVGTYNLTLRVTDPANAYTEISQTIVVESASEDHPHKLDPTLVFISIATVIFVILFIVVGAFFIKPRNLSESNKMALEEDDIPASMTFVREQRTEGPIIGYVFKNGRLNKRSSVGPPSQEDPSSNMVQFGMGIPRDDISILRRRLNIMHDNGDLTSEEHGRVIDLLGMIEE